jgi:CBS domain-containing protein
MDQAIAEPHDMIVAKIIEIEKKVSRPRKVIDDYACEVYTFHVQDTLSDVLQVIREKRFSKFPVYNNELAGLLTQKGIAGWMAANKQAPSAPDSIELADVLPFEQKDNVKFISMHTSVYQAEDIFRQQIGEGKRLEALLITKKGHPGEELMGMITAWDVLEIQ